MPLLRGIFTHKKGTGPGKPGGEKREIRQSQQKEEQGKGSDVSEHVIDLIRKTGCCGFSRGQEATEEGLSQPRRGCITSEGRES